MNGRAYILAALVGIRCTEPSGSRCENWTAPANARVLVFTRTAGFRHESIQSAITAVRSLGEKHKWATDDTEDPSAFTATALAAYDVIVFANTTGDVLDGPQEEALRGFVEGGGGFVGIHSATDTEYGWPWYGELVGARFASHAAVQTATLTVAASDHPSMACLPATFSRTDEWYDFQSRPSGATVLVSIDESSYDGATMGMPHPMVWTKQLGAGRSWYTAMGHTTESFTERLFRDHLANGIRWAAGQEWTGRR